MLDRDSTEVLGVRFPRLANFERDLPYDIPDPGKASIATQCAYAYVLLLSLVCSMSNTFSNDSLMTLYGDSDVQIFAAVCSYRFTELLSIYGCLQLLGRKSCRHRGMFPVLQIEQCSRGSNQSITVV